jgi:FtsZ-interacting cell division protein ZipA
MELNFSELDNVTTQNPYEQFNENDYGVDNNSDKYWEQAKSQKEQQTKKKKVSFTDILSNMNLVVSNKGVLQFIQPTQQHQQQDYQYEEQYYQGQQQGQQQRQPQQQRQNVSKQQQYVQPQQQQYAQPQKPVDPSVKHSYIYNKYFKDYADVTPQAPEKRVPKTIEEYNQMVYEDRIKRIEERKRISEIKSTKLMFTTTPDSYAGQVNPRNIRPSKNSLRKMSFG